MPVDYDPLPLKVQPDSALSIPYAFYIGKDGQQGYGGEHAYGDDRQHGIIDVTWEDYARGDAVKQILGNARVSNGRLKRTAPMTHPIFNQQFATNITGVQPIAWESKYFY